MEMWHGGRLGRTLGMALAVVSVGWGLRGEVAVAPKGSLEGEGGGDADVRYNLGVYYVREGAECRIKWRRRDGSAWLCNCAERMCTSDGDAYS